MHAKISFGEFDPENSREAIAKVHAHTHCRIPCQRVVQKGLRVLTHRHRRHMQGWNLQSRTGEEERRERGVDMHASDGSREPRSPALQPRSDEIGEGVEQSLGTLYTAFHQL